MLLPGPEGLLQEAEEVPGLGLHVAPVLGRLGVPGARLHAPGQAGVQSPQPDIHNSESEQQCSIIFSQLRGLLLLPGTLGCLSTFYAELSSEINFHQNLTFKVKTELGWDLNIYEMLKQALKLLRPFLKVLLDAPTFLILPFLISETILSLYPTSKY